MKLKEWAEKTGVSYLTAYRWFKMGTFPAKAYQTDSGTIIVEDDPQLENQLTQPSSNKSVSLFLNKVVEFSKNNATIEEFAADILANFNLTFIDPSKPNKVKPSPEEIQKRFQKFIPPKSEKPKPFMFIPENKDTFWEDVEKTESSQGLENLSEIKSSINSQIDNTSIDNVKVLQQEMSLVLGPASNSAIYFNSCADSLPDLNGSINLSAEQPAGMTFNKNLFSSQVIHDPYKSPLFQRAPINENFKTLNTLGEFNSNEPIISTVTKPKRGRPRKKGL